MHIEHGVVIPQTTVLKVWNISLAPICHIAQDNLLRLVIRRVSDNAEAEVDATCMNVAMSTHRST